MAKRKTQHETQLPEKTQLRKKYDWRRFFEILAATRNVSAACRQSGIPRATAYKWRDRKEIIRDHWNEALAINVDTLTQEAIRRARVGVEREKRHYYRGELLYTEKYREFSDTMLIFLLKSFAPEQFQERSRLDIFSEHIEKRHLRLDIHADIDERAERIVARTVERLSEKGVNLGGDSVGESVHSAHADE